VNKTVICIPTYNEAENIQTIIPAIFAVVPNVDILVIDDGSPDGTGAIVDRMIEEDDRIHVIHRKVRPWPCVHRWFPLGAGARLHARARDGRRFLSSTALPARVDFKPRRL
jgi:cellulose synthase/poly-beta-1,6-N-acetylglucosamine synthase-like glycosyltransferase